MATVSVFDVAAFVLHETGAISTMKLQKLVYYCQAWSLVWDGQPLFKEAIEAWANGPVVRSLFEVHEGQYQIDGSVLQPEGNPDRLSEVQKETVRAVLRYYGNKTSQWLSDLTHLEYPWRETRKGLTAKERGHREISLAMMESYYAAAYDEGVEIEA